MSPVSSALSGGFFTTSATWEKLRNLGGQQKWQRCRDIPPSSQGLESDYSEGSRPGYPLLHWQLWQEPLSLVNLSVGVRTIDSGFYLYINK